MANQPREAHRARARRAIGSLQTWLSSLRCNRRGVVATEYIAALCVCALALIVTYREYGYTLTNEVRIRVGLLSTGGAPQAVKPGSPESPAIKPGTPPAPGGSRPGRPGSPGRPGRPPRCTGDRCERPGKCFAAGTLVYTAAGDRPIETLVEGDLVWSRSDATGELSLKPVTARFITEQRPTLALEVESAAASETLQVTEGHPFWVQDHGWVDSDELAEGSLLWSPEGALVAHQASAFGERTKVYNLEVADFHTYFVGSLHAWVHNASGCPDGGVPADGGKPQVQCGELIVYKDRSKNDAQTPKMERDHVPSSAALTQRALFLFFGEELTPAMQKCMRGKDKKAMEKFAEKVGDSGMTIGIPKADHKEHSQTYGNKNKIDYGNPQRDARNLQNAALRNTAALVRGIRDECFAAYVRAMIPVTEKTNEQYDADLQAVIDAEGMKETRDALAAARNQCTRDGIR